MRTPPHAAEAYHMTSTLFKETRPWAQQVLKTLKERGATFLSSTQVPPFKFSVGAVEVFKNCPTLPLSKISCVGSSLYSKKAVYDKLKQDTDKKNWCHPDRFRGVITNSTRLTYASFVNTYIRPGLPPSTKDDTIRGFGELLGAVVGGQQLVFCESPADYVPMFKMACGSCMNYQASAHSSESRTMWRRVADTLGVYPASWYHYTGYIKGVYLVQHGVTVARAFLSRKEKTATWGTFHDVKGNSIEFASMLTTLLTERFEGPAESISMPWGFEVPGFEWEGKVLCPLPHCDFHQKGFYVTFNPETKMFVFAPEQGVLRITNTYLFGGFINSVSATRSHV